MKKTFRRISLLIVLAIVTSMFTNVTYAQAASVWSFICGSGKKVEVNDTITLQKNEYQDLNIYKSGKEIKTNDSTYKITWSSSNPDVVWINASTGKLRADRLKKMTTDTGTAKIIATIKNLKTGAVAKRGFTINVIKEKVKGYLDLTSVGWASYNAGLNENMTGGTAGKLYPRAKLEIINEKTNANGVLVCRVYAPDLGVECYVNKKYIKLESEKVAPTATPTVAPTATPTVAPTATPTVAPTAMPTVAPTATPTLAPTATPTPLPVVTKVYGTLDLSSAGWKSYSVGINSDFTGGTYGQIYQGAKLEILEECTNAKGTLVYKVYSGDLNKECYVTAKYVKVDSSAVPPQTEPVVTPIVIPEVKPEDNKKYGTLDISSVGWKSYSVGVNANFTGGTYGQIYQGAVLEILEECTNAKGTLVYKVYSADLGKECYVTAKYVTISTDNTVNNQEQTPDGAYGATINMFNTLLNSLNETKEVFSQSNYWIYDDYHKIHLPNLITDTGLIQQVFESIYEQTIQEKEIKTSLEHLRLLRGTLENDIYQLKEYRDSLSVKLLGGDTLKKSIDEVVGWFEWNSQSQSDQLIDAVVKEAEEARKPKYVYGDVRYVVVKGFDEKYFFKQTDYTRYVNEDGNNVGCTATALATAYSIYNKTLLDPGSNKIEWIAGKGVVWAPFAKHTNYYSNNLSAVYDLLEQDIPVIIRLYRTYKGEASGHSVTVVGIKDGVDRANVSTSNLLVIDPAVGKVRTLAESLKNYERLDSSWELIIPEKQ